MSESHVICKRCIYDSRIKNITFNHEGICNYCQMIDELQYQYKTGTPEGEKLLFKIIEKIKRDGKSRKYDCVIGVSGGTDSSFMVMKACEWGLRPLAVHYDNTWNTAIATENIRKVLSKLHIDLHTLVINNKEADDIILAFFKASVPDLDAATDIALAETLYRAADKYNVKYIFEGHSFITEGVSPLGALYMDGKYIQSVHRQFGAVPMQTYPNMLFWTFMKWIIVKRIKKIRPLWYIPYSKESAKQLLQERFGWEYYGGHHLENRITAFHHSYYNYYKFKVDSRVNSLAASVRAGFMTRDQALQECNTAPYSEPELVEYFKKRLNLTDQEFERIMKLPPKSFLNFPTYKKRFERLRPLFFILAKLHLVPMSFYVKYCFPFKA